MEVRNLPYPFLHGQPLYFFSDTRRRHLTYRDRGPTSAE